MSRERRRPVTDLNPLAVKLLRNLQANVRIVRTSLGWTQQELAACSKLSVSTIAEIEQGRLMNITLETYGSMASALGLQKTPVLLLEEPAKKERKRKKVFRCIDPRRRKQRP